MNSEERLALAQKGIEPDASRYGYTARPEQAKKRKKARKFVVTLKVIGLLVLMGSSMAIIFEQIQHNLFLARIPGADPLLFILFIALIPLTYLRIVYVTGLYKFQQPKEEIEKMHSQYIDDFDADSLEDICVNVDGTPMLPGGSFDANGNAYGCTDN